MNAKNLSYFQKKYEHKHSNPTFPNPLNDPYNINKSTKDQNQEQARLWILKLSENKTKKLTDQRSFKDQWRDQQKSFQPYKMCVQIKDEGK